MEKIRDFVQNNKKGFYLLVVFVIILVLYVVTKPKPKSSSAVDVSPKVEVLPPVSKEEITSTTSPAPAGEISSVNPRPSFVSTPVHSAPAFSERHVPTHPLVADISKYYSGKVDPYKPLVFPRSRTSGGNIKDIGAIPWPSEEGDTFRPKPLRLTGVVLDKKPVAIIEDEKGDYVVRAGESFSNYKVMAISTYEVVLKKEDKLVTLKIE